MRLCYPVDYKASDGILAFEASVTAYATGLAGD